MGRIQLFSSRLSRLPDDPLAFAPSASVVVPAYFLESFSASIGTKVIASDRVLLIQKSTNTARTLLACRFCVILLEAPPRKAELLRRPGWPRCAALACAQRNRASCSAPARISGWFSVLILYMQWLSSRIGVAAHRPIPYFDNRAEISLATAANSAPR